MRKYSFVFIAFTLIFLLAGCNGEVEVGYSPPIAVPIRVSINSHGSLNVEFSGKWVTPVGTFDIGTSADIYSIQNQYTYNVLIVRVDKEAVVYELQPGKEFRVDFDDDQTLYKRVALKYKTNGDIILELESVQQTVPSSQSDQLVIATEKPQPTKPAQTTTPEKFLFTYFSDIVNRRNYGYLWTLSTDRFKQANSDGDYQDYVDFWDSVESVSVHSLNCSIQSSSRAYCQITMTWHINGKDIFLNVDYDLVYDNKKNSWIFG